MWILFPAFKYKEIYKDILVLEHNFDSSGKSLKKFNNSCAHNKIVKGILELYKIINISQVNIK